MAGLPAGASTLAGLAVWYHTDRPDPIAAQAGPADRRENEARPRLGICFASHQSDVVNGVRLVDGAISS